ncbi:MAG: aminotransferase class V-fold PLP-dependent enzyme [Ignavibacteria bacterium]|jgi:selenocysteine lyase/cysteine desulfurase|nr:aminotransferase class V-fold PLP-dependent enzyme [Ignavibacteria bacterium]MCU7502006.1 aminotransferase class V-fold PLP-dependent enzyme [Ignavibacteria bacterium]MCU7516974.1 aminotransferase class V-fold PLP-dependent enzyme [Ignavibacteria bacterium]
MDSTQKSEVIENKTVESNGSDSIEELIRLEENFNLHDRIFGIDRRVPLLDGRCIPYVNLDNAASTPPFVEVMKALEAFMPYYSSVHRGTGFKSRLSTAAYDKAHETIGRFVGADLNTNTVIFGKNTSEALNKLSYRLEIPEDKVVITSRLEHHSNDLPWRDRANVVHVKATYEGRFDEEDFDRLLEEYKGRIALVAVTGASNVTGFIQPIHRLARKAHEAGARILVDGAQLAPHRKIDMKPDNDPEHLDFVVLAGHKMYAPFGTGALVGPKEVFLKGKPEYSGGGTVNVVTQDEVYWGGTPDRDEAGSPNVPGAVAMATAAKVLMNIGMDRVAEHERVLTAYCLERLRSIPGVTIYGETDPAKAEEKVGVIPFNLEGVPHFLLSSILGYEGGIGVRSGCFCAHPYVVHLLHLSDEEAQSWRTQMLQGDKSDMPGMVRISFGCYNTMEDIDKLLEMVEKVSRGEYSGKYQVIKKSGEYMPENYCDVFDSYFSLDKVDEGK